MTLTRLAPEEYDVANAYLQCGSIEETAKYLQVPVHVITKTLREPNIKTYLDQIYLDLGYRNKNKLGALLDKMIDAKIEEAEETGIYTKKDLLELITLAHKMRMDEIKAEKEVNNVVNIANIGQETNYGRLMRTLLPQEE
jgi:hypothetical protein